MAREVICTTKDPDGPNDCRCIDELGVKLTTIGSTITRTPEQPHIDLKDGKDYYIEYGGSETDLIPAEREGTKYVRTEPNDTSDDNLLQIQDC